jgi:hypothetical protein
MTETGNDPEYGPHDIRGWSAQDILLGVFAGAELWNNGGYDEYEMLTGTQRELLDRAAAAMPDDDESGDKVASLRTWDTATLAVTLRAAGTLWQSTGGADPNDVLSTIQKDRLDRATQLVVTANDFSRLTAGGRQAARTAWRTRLSGRHSAAGETVTLDSAPMKAGEYGRYVCVAHGGCLHSPRIAITADGVWVRQRPAGVFTSAHRDCFERWAADEAAAQPAE